MGDLSFMGDLSSPAGGDSDDQVDSWWRDLDTIQSDFTAGLSSSPSNSSTCDEDEILQWLDDKEPHGNKRARAAYAEAEAPGLIKWLSGSLTYERALELLTNPSAEASGARPVHVSCDLTAVEGVLYKEFQPRKRATGSDIWEAKGGKRGSILLPGSPGKPSIRRHYGRLTTALRCSRLTSAQTATSLRWVDSKRRGQVLRFHKYTLESGSKDGPKCRLYHILPLDDRAPGSQGATPAAQAQKRVHDDGEPRDEPATNHSASTTLQGALHLQNDGTAEAPWVVFEGADGVAHGSIEATATLGPKISSRNGDLAEWHQRDPSERPFEEGDVVGFGSQGLTRRTVGIRQLGVITRRAVVEGSLPLPAQKADFDTVAYCGRIPVKLRGGCKQHDFITPSGLEDGTAVASPTFPAARLGRALQETLAAQRDNVVMASELGGCQMVEICVTNPADTVGEIQVESKLVRLLKAEWESFQSWLAEALTSPACAPQPQAPTSASLATETFSVGPIWSNDEAAAKANQWAEANKPGEGWTFTGEWYSSGGTSYCHFQRLVPLTPVTEQNSFLVQIIGYRHKIAVPVILAVIMQGIGRGPTFAEAVMFGWFLLIICRSPSNEQSVEAREQCEQQPREEVIRTEIFGVGPIWSNDEAAAKANQWAEANKPGEGWTFTGEWYSSGGTSYCHFQSCGGANTGNTSTTHAEAAAGQAGPVSLTVREQKWSQLPMLVVPITLAVVMQGIGRGPTFAEAIMFGLILLTICCCGHPLLPPTSPAEGEPPPPPAALLPEDPTASLTPKLMQLLSVVNMQNMRSALNLEQLLSVVHLEQVLSVVKLHQVTAPLQPEVEPSHVTQTTTQS
jgi:hypothetical protein